MKLKRYRENLNLTATEVAKYVGVNKAVISRYENNVRKLENMRLGNAVKLRDILQLDNTKDILKFEQE